MRIRIMLDMSLLWHMKSLISKIYFLTNTHYIIIYFNNLIFYHIHMIRKPNTSSLAWDKLNRYQNRNWLRQNGKPDALKAPITKIVSDILDWWKIFTTKSWHRVISQKWLAKQKPPETFKQAWGELFDDTHNIYSSEKLNPNNIQCWLKNGTYYWNQKWGEWLATELRWQILNYEEFCSLIEKNRWLLLREDIFFKNSEVIKNMGIMTSYFDITENDQDFNSGIIYTSLSQKDVPKGILIWSFDTSTHNANKFLECATIPYIYKNYSL